MLTSRFAMWLGWGGEFYFFCNDAYAPTLGLKRDASLGLSARKVWEEIWSDIGPRAESVVQTGEATWDESLLLFLERSGYVEETYHTFSYSPVPNDDGSVGGMLCVVTEETERVIGERRLALLRDLGSALAASKLEEEIWQAVAAHLGGNSRDLPFALVYLCAPEGAAQLACAHQAQAGSLLAPLTIQPNRSDEAWPAGLLLEGRRPLVVDDLAARFPDLPKGPWDRPARAALLVPIAQQGQMEPAGFLVAGLNPYRRLDEAYRGFLDLLAAQIAAGLASAHAFEAERKRAEALEEIDRAKTAFFSNVSHEFRTPLTLMLGPLAEVLEQPVGPLQEEGRSLVAVAHRNGLRLLKLVNSLLDFSRLKAGRAKAQFAPTDFAAFTAELASSFRSAMEKAGLRFLVDCEPISEPIYLDREMWEKVVLNLLSNAFKFTLQGEIRVEVHSLPAGAELIVRDTGAGIPLEAQPHLFERFYRVQGAQSRTHEGSGIGLALVHDLVKLHGGSVRVESRPGEGSAFIIAIPHGHAHLPTDQISSTRAESRPEGSASFVVEALRWLPGEEPAAEYPPEDRAPVRIEWSADHQRPRILLADDNQDMREYILRLLAPHSEITAVADGQAALEAARSERPDLVLTDVMMPRLDGFGLLRAFRADPQLQAVPVILLSARAGEEARVEGLDAGADDYLTKPFHARELIAKVKGTLSLARARAEAMHREAELLAERTELLDSINLGFFGLDADYRIFYLNAEATHKYGLDPAAYVGRIFWEVFPEIIGTPFEEAYRRVMAERVAQRFEALYPPSQQWFEISAYPMNGGRLGIFFRDITERKRADEALRASETQLRLIADTAPVLIAHCDREHRYLFVNEPYAARFGFTREQVIGRRIGEVIGEAAYASIRQYVEQALSGSLAEFDLAIPYEKLGQQYMRCAYAPERAPSGEVVGLVAIILDITEHHKAALALAENEQRLRAIFDGTHEYIGLMTPDGVLIEANRSSLAFGEGTTRGEVIGRAFWDGIWFRSTPGAREMIREAVARAAQGETLAFEAPISTAAGEERTFAFSLAPIRNEAGEVILIVPESIDVTARKRAELLLVEQKRLLEQANQSKDRFLAVLSHELRTPLTPVLMTVSSLESDPDLPPTLREDLGMVKRNIELETKLIDDLLDLNRIINGKLSLRLDVVDLNETIRDVCAICRSAIIERGLLLETDLDPTAGPVRADLARLQQVLWNVLKNAIKFTPETGLIQIQTRRLGADRSEVRIHDTGVGIPEDTLPHIFDAFEQGSMQITRQYGGLGLGLAICKALVELHEGAIRAESTGDGQGATFVIELPNVAAAAAQKQERTGTSDRPSPLLLKLLVVEDHPDTSRMLKRLLERAGYTVTSADTVAGALAAVESETFDVLITDLGLPDGNGYDVIRGVWSRSCIPAIAMSGYGMEEDLRRSREAGFCEHLVKPVDAPQLLNAVHRAANS